MADSRRMPVIAAALFAFLALATWTLPVTAADDDAPLPRPEGPVILTITGAIERTNAPGKAEFDFAMIEALGTETLITGTSWTDGPQIFDGVRARRILDRVGARGDTIRAVALNDYAAEIPTKTLDEYDVLFAYRQNGVTMSARDKGPLWIVFPRDDYPVLNDPRVDLYWVWQLRTVDVR